MNETTSAPPQPASETVAALTAPISATCGQVQKLTLVFSDSNYRPPLQNPHMRVVDFDENEEVTLVCIYFHLLSLLQVPPPPRQRLKHAHRVSKKVTLILNVLFHRHPLPPSASKTETGNHTRIEFIFIFSHFSPPSASQTCAQSLKRGEQGHFFSQFLFFKFSHGPRRVRQSPPPVPHAFNFIDMGADLK